MKAASMIVRYADGTLYSEASESLESLMVLAKRIRAAGEYEGQACDAVCVLASWRAGPAYQARCVKAEPKPIAEPKSEPRKKK